MEFLRTIDSEKYQNELEKRKYNTHKAKNNSRLFMRKADIME